MLKVFVLLLTLFSTTATFATTDITSQTIFDTDQLQAPAEQEWKFRVPPFSVEHQVRLNLDARVDWPSLAGSNPWLRVAVNGHFLTKEQLLNKRNRFKVTSGLDLTWTNDDRWRILYSPNFEDAIIKKDDLMAAPDADPYHFVWDITNVVKPGENTLKIYHLKVLPTPTTLILRNVRFEVGKAIAPPPSDIVIPAPTGPLMAFEARSKKRNIPLEVILSDDGGLTLTAAGKEFEVSTRTSLPQGKWLETRGAGKTHKLLNGQSASTHWKAGSYSIRREVKVLDDHTHIADTLTNDSQELTGIIVRHHLKYPSAPTNLLVGGRMARSNIPTAMNIPEHPSVFAQWQELGVGLIAEDDVFRVHIKSYNDSYGMGLADEQLGLAPGASVTLEWNIYPTPRKHDAPGDYWDFVNAVRHNWGSNFTIPGPLAFVPRFDASLPVQDSSRPARWYADWVQNRGLKVLVSGIARFPEPPHKYAHGTAILSVPQWVANEREWAQKLHSLRPDVLILPYFHAQISSEPNSEIKYADSRLLNEDGEQLSYPDKNRMPLYLPTRANSYGKALWGYVHTAINDMETDGLYWDEMNWSMLKDTDFGAWDNHTVAIDMQSHDVIKKRVNVTLAMQPLQLDIIRYLKQHEKSLIANTQAVTRTMLNEKIVRFVETQSYSALINTHFGSPIGLGNHIAETGQADTARQIRAMLEYGAVYYADTQYEAKKPPSWPFVSIMYPITPVELREGMVLGTERIQTTRSGRFSWPNGEAAEVYVIDGNGNRVTAPSVEEIVEKGKHFYDVRIPSDHFAVLVKQTPATLQ